MDLFPRLAGLATAAVAVALGCDPSSHGAPSSGLPSRAAAPPASHAAALAGGAPEAAQKAGPAPDAGPVAAAPLRAATPLVALPVAGYPAAVVSLPLGATARRPVVIASHGNYDRPEWQCEVWREIVGDAAFVLCPRGVPRPDSPSADDVRFTYESNGRLEQEIDGGLKALRERFPEHVDGDAVLYTGFSLGAIMGVSIASRRPALFPRLVLVEGGHDKWTERAVKAFREGGGQRVLFVCAQGGCGAAARGAAARLGRAGVATRVVQSREAGHRYDGPVAGETKRALSWALEGDARWSAP